MRSLRLIDAMLRVIYQHGQKRIYDSDWITDQVRRSGFWDTSNAKSPERSVNMYFAQRYSHMFDHCGRNLYRLRKQYFRNCAA